MLGAVLILIATAAYATAIIIVNRGLAGLDPLGPVAMGLGLSAVALVPAAVVVVPDRPPTAAALWSLVVLGVVCTALGLILFFQLITEAGPSRAAVITSTNPVVAVVLGALVLNERLGPVSITGLLAILAGSWLSTGARPPTLSRLIRTGAATANAERINEEACPKAVGEDDMP